MEPNSHWWVMLQYLKSFPCNLGVLTIIFILCHSNFIDFLLNFYFFHVFSAADWRYAAEQFVKQLPDKVIVHRKFISWFGLPIW